MGLNGLNLGHGADDDEFITGCQGMVGARIGLQVFTRSSDSQQRDPIGLPQANIPDGTLIEGGPCVYRDDANLDGQLVTVHQ
ncbi:MAG: hypothetical protein BWY76_02183 [bacterium ADurb.Bin429]|nr:MAG: hypothetical protein BWY76_02183 [bacterium ADurb.Bin429]